MMNRKWIHIILILLVGRFGFSQSSVVDTKHNLSVSGPGEIKASTEEQVCIFCHASHNANPQVPLWNRYDLSTTFTLYGSPTMETQTMQPDVESRLCLSCHDGTVAVGLVRTRDQEISFPLGLERIPLDHRTNLTTDLSDDHPLNLDMTNRPTEELACTGCHDTHNPETPTSDRLRCSSCHNPHDNTFGDFLVTTSSQGELCALCHAKEGWNASVHNTSLATWNGAEPDPWPYSEMTSVADNACQNCHESHGNGSTYWLQKASSEEDNCLICHNANVAQTDISAALMKPSIHPVMDYQDVHTPNEDPAMMQRHVECTDCHNPHQIVDTSAEPPQTSGVLAGVSGIDQSGAFVEEAQYEYAVCYKCHETDDLNTHHYVPRLEIQTSIRLEFAPGNPSYHPVAAVGQNPDVQSLIAPLTPSSQIYCTDCHNNDEFMNIGSPSGPHGSSFAPILSAQMLFVDGNPESSTIYALCYQCHDRTIILDPPGYSRKNPHRRHLRDEEVSCTTCHDPHGVYNNTHLINFNENYVEPNSDGLLAFIDGGYRTGTCYLLCHGEDHRAGMGTY